MCVQFVNKKIVIITNSSGQYIIVYEGAGRTEQDTRITAVTSEYNIYI